MLDVENEVGFFASGTKLDEEVRGFGNVAVLALREPPRNALATSWIVASTNPHRYGHDQY